MEQLLPSNELANSSAKTSVQALLQEQKDPTKINMKQKQKGNKDLIDKK